MTASVGGSFGAPTELTPGTSSPANPAIAVLRVGTKLLFNSSVAGKAVIQIVGTGCTKFLPAGKDFDEERKKKCSAANDKTTIRAAAKGGANRITYLGKSLTPGGDYRVTLTVTDTSGQTSAPRSTSFSLDGDL